MTSISKHFDDCDLQSVEVIEALKSGNQGVIDQVASKIYSNMLRVDVNRIQDTPNWPQKDQKLKYVLHTLVEVLGGVLQSEDLVQQAQRTNYVDAKSTTDLAYELKFLLLDLLALYNDLHYSTWNLLGLFAPDNLSQAQLASFIAPAVQSPRNLVTAVDDNTSQARLKQTLSNCEHWCQVYKSLMLRTYEANENDTIVAFHSLLAVAAQLISASHVASLLLFSHAKLPASS